MTFAVRRAAVAMGAYLAFATTIQAQPVHVNPEGIGQVLIYPYYTVRNGWATLLSIVNNDSANGKAVKLRFMEGKNGAPVASLNIFLGPDDVWTGAVVAGSSADQPPKLISNDKSCTWPNLRSTTVITETGAVVTTPSLAFSNQSYVADGDSVAVQVIDRTREGYFEVIEMASIPFAPSAPSPLIRQINSLGGQSSPCAAISDADLPRYASQISAPNGGLSGAGTLLNVLGGAAAEYSAVSLSGFWSTVANLAPEITASASQLPNLASGGNRIAQSIHDGRTYFSKFNRSIDAVSAALMSNELLGEHAFTVEGTIGTSWVVVTPTKRFYTQGVVEAPFSHMWDGSVGASCDEIAILSYDREGYSLPDDGCGYVCPPPPTPQGLCYSASILSFGGLAYSGGDIVFGSLNNINYGHFEFRGAQNGGASVAVAGKEGGKTRLQVSSSVAQLVAVGGSIASIDQATDMVSLATGLHAFHGLPMIGVVFTQSSFRLGNPQQNFASGSRLQSTRRITTP